MSEEEPRGFITTSRRTKTKGDNLVIRSRERVTPFHCREVGCGINFLRAVCEAEGVNYDSVDELDEARREALENRAAAALEQHQQKNHTPTEQFIVEELPGSNISK